MRVGVGKKMSAVHDCVPDDSRHLKQHCDCDIACSEMRAAHTFAASAHSRITVFRYSRGGPFARIVARLFLAAGSMQTA